MDETPARMPEVQVPTLWTFSGLALGLVLGLFLQTASIRGPALAVAEPIGALWLRGLQMAIMPLVAGLLFTGIVRTVAAARAGAMARRTLGFIALVLLVTTTMSALLMPALLTLLPIPSRAAEALAAPVGEKAPLPGFADFLFSMLPSNVFTSAAADALLPVLIFVSLFAVASTRLADEPRRLLATLFEGIAGAMLVVIGWVLKLAPIGVFCLALGVATKSGAAAFGALAHYIVLVAGIGFLVMLGGYVVAVVWGRQRLGTFARAVASSQAVAFSTQSSIASVPAMLGTCRMLGIRSNIADFVLPLAVVLFRATSPAMNLGVAIYVARLTGTPLTAPVIGIGVAVALMIAIGTPSLPGSISFISAIGPIAIAMGVPIAPLALLVAVEMLPDIMRTVGNVTMDVALATVVDRAESGGEVSGVRDQ